MSHDHQAICLSCPCVPSAQGSAPLTRSQVHELLAAAAGFATHAAFHHQAAWCDLAWRDTGLAPDEYRVTQRCLHFGLSPEEALRATQSLTNFLRASGYAPVRFEELIAALASNEDEWVEADEAESPVVAQSPSIALISRIQQSFDAMLGDLPLLLEGLEAAAARGIAAAHLAIARMLEPHGGLSDEDDRRFGRELRRRGQWSVEPVDLAEIAVGVDRFIRVAAKHRHHLLAAARAGIGAQCCLPRSATVIQERSSSSRRTRLILTLWLTWPMRMIDPSWPTNG